MAEMNRRRFLALSMITPAAAMAATANHRFVSLPGQAASGGGTQHRLFCPASCLKQGANEIIFDHHLTKAMPVAFASTLA